MAGKTKKYSGVACPKCRTVHKIPRNSPFRVLVHCIKCDLHYAALKKFDHEADRLNRKRKKK